MKKCWILLSVWMIFQIKLQANTVFFTWYDTEINIPLGDPLEPYVQMPYATLNPPNEDPNIYYERNGVNYTYQSVIQTHVVKTYRIDFKVYSPKYRITSIQTITFKVIDQIAPTFSALPMFEIPVYATSVNYTLGVRYEDNYTPVNQLILSIDSNAVNLNQVGLYPVMFTLSDTSGNTTQAMTYVRVRDYYAPMITQIKPLILDPNSVFELSDYFLMKDNYDAFVSIWIHDEYVDYTRLGNYPITIEVYDSSGNMNQLETTLTIEDRTPPDLVLLSNQVTLSWNEPYELKDLILKVKDNYSHLTVDDVQITTDLDLTTVGFYEALFEITDEAGLKTSHLVTLYVTYKKQPELIFEPLVIELNEAYDLMTGIQINHPFDVNIMVYDSNVQMKSGTYEVVYLCSDIYGNHAIFTRTVTVQGETNQQTLWTTIVIGLLFLGITGGGFIWFWKKRTT